LRRTVGHSLVDGLKQVRAGTPDPRAACRHGEGARSGRGFVCGRFCPLGCRDERQISTALPLALFASVSVPANAGTVTTSGGSGTNGSNGVNPGDPGTVGTPAPAVSFTEQVPADSVNSSTVYGGTGGTGGNGCSTSPGPYGNGANGGAGGFATAGGITNVASGGATAEGFAIAGNGGTAAAPGGPGALGAMGGAGGGFSASSSAITGDFSTVYSEAYGTGGAGGDAYGLGGQAGAGGTGTVSAYGQGVGSYVEVRHRLWRQWRLRL
jgi:hypothetical protein